MRDAKASASSAQPRATARGGCRLPAARGVARLLADAEAGEDPTEKIVRTEGAGDLAQCLLGLAQVFGKQLACTGEG